MGIVHDCEYTMKKDDVLSRAVNNILRYIGCLTAKHRWSHNTTPHSGRGIAGWETGDDRSDAIPSAGVSRCSFTGRPPAYREFVASVPVVAGDDGNTR